MMKEWFVQLGNRLVSEQLGVWFVTCCGIRALKNINTHHWKVRFQEQDHDPNWRRTTHHYCSTMLGMMSTLQKMRSRVKDKRTHLLQEEGDEERTVDIPEHVQKNRELRRKVGRRAFEYVQRLHKNLGHVTPEVLAKMLGEVLATDDVITAAKEYICPVCYARKRPAQVPPSSSLKSTEFNQRIQVDTHWILCEESSVREREPAPGTPAARRKDRGELTGRQCVMTIVDHATRYCSVRILKAETAEEFTKGVERCWFKHFGAPKILRIDEAKGWSSKHVREWASSRSIALEVQPAEQHSWLGVVERKHQVVRRALELYQDDIGRHDLPALKEAAIYVPHTINQMEMVKGFTPQQWVLGKNMTNVHGLTSEIYNPGQEALDDAGIFAQVQQRRLRTQIAWIKADTDAKLRRAFNQKFIDVKETMVVGQRCWYWRVAGSGILHKAKWRGPAGNWGAGQCSSGLGLPWYQLGQMQWKASPTVGWGDWYRSGGWPQGCP